MALWLIPMLYVAGTLCFGIVFLRLEHEYLVQHKINLSQWFFNDFSIASAQACLVRISHTAWCVGAANQRKLLCSNDLSPTRRAPRCRQSVARICLDSQLLKDAK